MKLIKVGSGGSMSAFTAAANGRAFFGVSNRGLNTSSPSSFLAALNLPTRPVSRSCGCGGRFRSNPRSLPELAAPEDDAAVAVIAVPAVARPPMTPS